MHGATMKIITLRLRS